MAEANGKESVLRGFFLKKKPLSDDILKQKQSIKRDQRIAKASDKWKQLLENDENSQSSVKTKKSDVWNSQIVHQLLWEGVPPKYREAVWFRSIGNHLQISETFYSILLREARLTRENLQNQINHHLPSSRNRRFVPSHNRAFSTSSSSSSPHSHKQISIYSSPITSPVMHKSPSFHSRTPRSAQEKTDPVVSPSESIIEREVLYEDCKNENSLETPQTNNEIYETLNENESKEEKTNEENNMKPPDENDESEEEPVEDSPPSAADYLGCASKDSLLAKKIASVRLIPLDMPRTFAMLGFFQLNGPFREPLQNVLEAFVVYKPNIGYVQGMSYLVAFLLISVSDEHRVFVMLANLLSWPIMKAFYSMDAREMTKYFHTFVILCKMHTKTIYKRFLSYKLDPRMFLVDWVMTLFCKSLPLDVAARAWDVIFGEGEWVIFKVALGLLLYLEEGLENGFEKSATLLTNLPQEIDEAKLFERISEVNLTKEEYSKAFKSAKSNENIFG